MAEYTFEQMLTWVGVFSEKMNVSPEKIKLLNLCGKVRNVVSTIETHKRVILFANDTQPGLFYEIWEAGLGEYDLWYAKGLTPGGEIVKTTASQMMDTKITEPMVIFVMNEKTRESLRFGIKNEVFTRGPIRYVGNEIRAVIMSLLSVATHDIMYFVSAETIAIEAAMAAQEGTMIAIECDDGSYRSMEENVEKFKLHNIEIVRGFDEDKLAPLPLPRLSFVVATKYLERDLERLLRKQPKQQFVIYTLDLGILSQVKGIFERQHIRDMEIRQITVSKLGSDGEFRTEPSPWLITGTTVE